MGSNRKTWTRSSRTPGGSKENYFQNSSTRGIFGFLPFFWYSCRFWYFWPFFGVFGIFAVFLIFWPFFDIFVFFTDFFNFFFPFLVFLTDFVLYFCRFLIFSSFLVFLTVFGIFDRFFVFLPFFDIFVVFGICEIFGVKNYLVWYNRIASRFGQSRINPQNVEIEKSFGKTARTPKICESNPKICSKWRYSKIIKII